MIKKSKDGMIFICHEATKTGAPLVLLNLCKEYKKKNKDFVIVLMSGGELESEFKKLAKVINLKLTLFEKKDIYISSHTTTLFALLKSKGYNKCIANTVLTGFLKPFMEDNCIKTIYLIHEMPEIIKEFQLEKAAINIANSNSNLIFPSFLVAEQFCEEYIKNKRDYHIIPQGISDKMVCKDKQKAKEKILARINSKNKNAKVILSAGLTQQRKGTDLFLDIIKICNEKDKIKNLEFIWLGDRDSYYNKWLIEELPKLEYKSHIHFINFVDDPSDYFGASDIFLLTSREDPLPGVALIALKNKIPLIMFENTGGIEEYINNKNGIIIPQFDTIAMATKMIKIIESEMKIESNVLVNTTSEYLEKVLNAF